jgi:hypothetical protein
MKIVIACVVLCLGGTVFSPSYRLRAVSVQDKILRIKQDDDTQTICIYRDKDEQPILTQNVPEDARAYLHPIVAPDGKGLITEYRPSHHRHQTGMFWGLKLVNGRDYFMKWQSDYYRRVSTNVIQKTGSKVQWESVYDMLDEKGNVVITETQNWSMQQPAGKYVLDLKWSGQAKTDVTISKYYVGGLFVRMPWHSGIPAEVVNAVGQRNSDAEAQRAIWTDVGMQVDGRDDMAHVAIFDHPNNDGFPTGWRVDNQFGIGPSRQIMGDWSIEKGKTQVFRYRLIIYTGTLDPVEMTRAWKAFVKEY